MKFKNIFNLFFALIIAMSLSGCTSGERENPELTTTYLIGTSVINENNQSELCGLVDYVFVAKVEEVTGVEYMNPITLETEKGSKIISTPVTEYKITVLDNVKGTLKKNTPISIFKEGGISEDGKSYILFENDFLPQKGDCCIFFASAQKDGWIGVSGGTSNVLISKEFLKNIKASKEYKILIESYKKEIKFDRIRYTASAEE